jgi:beta-galactosidase
LNFNLDDRILHGGDYNPEQWQDYPNILQDDIDQMKLAHVNTVTLGVFAWGALEPAEGVYDFIWMDQVFERIQRMGGNVILATPSAVPPVWMSEEYPEINRTDDHGQRHTHSFRQMFCFSSPIYRAKVREINQQLANRYGQHPALAMWHVSNEYSGACYCPLCEAKWQRWLEHRYHTLAGVNEAWVTTFWGSQYSAWSQIKVPGQLNEHKNHGMALDWQRFCTDQLIDFCDAEQQPLRAANPTIPVTTNFMAEGNDGHYIPLQGIDYGRFAQHLDVVSWDSYPQWDFDQSVSTIPAVQAAFIHDLYYGLKQKPFIVMESSPSRVNSPIAKAKRPGIHLLSTMQQVAHGADGTLYFQWRQSRGNSEKFHGAVIDHTNDTSNRVFQEVAHYGQMLEKLSRVKGSKHHAQVAILLSWESQWAMYREAAFGRNRKEYFQMLQKHYQYFWEHDIPVTVVTPDTDLSDFALVIAPMLYLMTDALAERLKQYVVAGGKLVGSYMMGIVDEHDQLIQDQWRPQLSDVFGIELGEFDSLYLGETNEITFAGQTFVTHDFDQLVKPVDAKVLGKYNCDFYAGSPAVTSHRFGQGQAFYVGARLSSDFITAFYDQVLGNRNKWRPDFLQDGNPVVSVQSRENEQERFVFTMNFSSTVQRMQFSRPLTEIETGESSQLVELVPYGVKVYSEPIT